MDVDRRSFLRATWAAALGAGLLPRPLCAARPRRTTGRRFPTEAQIRAADVGLWRLTDLINAYRRHNGLAAVDFSPRLTAVAALHARDLAERGPHERWGSLHSWSSDGRWTGGPYRTGDRATWPVMWHKPREIARYPGLGFEVSVAGGRDMRHCVALWRNSPTHNDVILGRGVWHGMHWRAVGAAFFKGYACAWFGEEVDLT